ncbi:hypothetical protein A2397_04050 [Candidatus Amesbacteria bacterium RIFOXYB1_FULL_44_23]|uniref:Glycosyltransferase RgtA/B/C/D-like domain-containing protein n=1 Tax=Candidatus Amesbacteria bacterium RIFOXYB1_FULL_44_23 TaxID=1797263 RepID=A0A1F4ZQJ2_9BACT|nr:MAG: hypothetical protein A2397_04050 [Candidatus Amesbacteria bacterium RIFOXYB1_FULL_44_23]
MSKYFPLLLVIIAFGLFCRGFAFQSRYIYAHDSDLASWMVKDILVDHHLRLVGQETSSSGIFIGPLFYYSLIPFYLISGMDPIGSVAYSWIIGLFSVASIYYVFSRIHNPKIGLIAGLIHAVSYGISVNEREVVPTTPVMLWTVWFYYAVHRLMAGDKKSLWLLAFLFGLVWHLNLALGLLAIIVVIGLLLKRNHFHPRDLLMPLLIFVVMSLPLIIFEARHDYQQSRALMSTLSSIGSPKPGSPSLLTKFQKTASYAGKNVHAIYWLDGKLSPYFPLFLMFGLIWTKFKKPRFGIHLWIYGIWLAVYWIFFSLHPINLSEYYLNGINILWIAMAAHFLVLLMDTNNLGKAAAFVLITGFLAVNLNLQLTANYSKNGYIQKKAIIQAIKTDVLKRGIPCISVSYITNPGYNLGYRYFIYLSGLKTRPVTQKVPVYSIVFPLSLVDQVDQTFGDLGLIYPQYERYSPETAKIECVGQDSNLSDPMFGFTK